MIFETCPACHGEGAIPHGQRWSDGEPDYWEPCIECGSLGEVEVEAYELEGDEDGFFGGGETDMTKPKNVIQGLLAAFRECQQVGALNRDGVEQFMSLSADDRSELLFCITLLGARNIADRVREMVEQIHVEPAPNGTAATAADEISAPGPASTRQ